MAGTEFVRLTGHRHFRQRLILATLTGRSVHISGIRASSPTQPGLAPHEVSFLRLLEAVTNGSSIQISYTGTTITYHPGLITGTVAGAGATEDDVIEHYIPAGCTRGITYYLLPIALLAPFSKAHVNIRCSGPGVITSATANNGRHGGGDMSADAFRLAVLPLYGLFGIPPARIELVVRQRACTGTGERRGNGVVELRFAAQVRLPRTLHLYRRAGRVKRIVGVAYSCGVSAANNKRMIHAARGVLNALTGEIKIAEAPPGRDDARSKTGIGFGLCLVAEANVAGVVYAADAVSPPQGGVLAEDVAVQCAHRLLQTIAAGGCAAHTAAPTLLTLMAMGSEDVGRLLISNDVVGSEDVISLARDLKAFGASSWGIRPAEDDEEDGDGSGGSGGSEDEDEDGGGEAAGPDESTGNVIVSIKGLGLGNVGRKVA